MTKWKTCLLGDEIELAYGKALPEYVRVKGNVPVFGSNGIVGFHETSLVSGPGIIIGRKGSVGEVAYSSQPFWPIDTSYFVVNKGKNNWKFLFYLLKSIELTKLNRPSPVPGLNRQDAYSLTISFPSIDEQEKIANVLDCIAYSIELENQAIKITRSLKNAIMSSLFTQGLRGESQKETEIGLIPDHWVFNNLHPYIMKPEYGFTASANHAEIGPRFLRITDIQDGNVNWNLVPFCACNKKNLVEKRLIANDIVVARIGATTGKAFLIESCPEAIFASYLIRLRTKESMLDPRFLYYFMQSNGYWNQIEKQKGGKLKGGINIPILSSLYIAIPPQNEQQEIIEILESLDQKIQIQKNKQEILKNLFNTLLHKLLVGEIRVSDLDLSAVEKSADLAGAFA